MRRREFIALVGGAALALPPLASLAQVPTGLPKIAVLAEGRQMLLPPTANPIWSSFFQGMHEVGYVEGHDFEMVFRFADGDYRRLPVLADELVALRPSIFMTATVAGTLAIRKVTTTIPIVHPALTDPITFGFIASLAQPGGQVTGLLATLDTLPGKQLQLALELVPGATRIGILLNASNPAMAAHLRGVEVAAATLAVKLVRIEARLPTELEAAFQKVANGNIELLLVVQDSMFIIERERIAALARIPTVYGFKEHVVAGGLISYGFSVRDNWRRAAGHVAKILKGAKPGDLPVELPTRLELVINLKTAKALGLTVPPSLLARADEVIE